MSANAPITATAVLQPLFFSLFLLVNSFQCSHANTLTTEKTMVPLIEAGKRDMMSLILNDSRRKLNGFQICALCTCCNSGNGDGSGKYCLPSPCCYAINCNIPNRPFGFCSFTPKTCNCFGCHL